MKNNYDDLPQLIVALDSKDDTANYIHINDVKEDVVYYCPCCKGVVKPRAYKKENDYQVQPHFYHESGGCSEESFVHYICKTWLFENGSVFMVDGDTFTVSSIEAEKTLHTSFGDYRPDIIVETKEGKTFFFEIAYSSKKSAHYIPVWDELGNDVIEINAREFINQKHNNDIPEFKVIYSDGECYVKSYTRNDYDDTIGKRKLEWKRQDKLNYKIKWEKLDWFWNDLCAYKDGTIKIEDVVLAFDNLEYDDMNFCILVVKKMKCQDLYEELKFIINKKFKEMINTFNISPYEKIKIIEESPRISYIAFQITHVDKIIWYNSICLNRKVEYYDKNILNKVLSVIDSEEFKKNIPTCPCLKEIMELKYKKKLTKENVSFYLNDRIAIHWNYRYKRKCKLFGSVDDISLNSYISGYCRVKEILDIGGYRRSLSKSEHKTHMQLHDNDYKRALVINSIIKKINDCRNGYWKCYYSNVTKRLDVDMFINNLYISGFWLDIDDKSKHDIFKETKINMNRLLDRAKNLCGNGNIRIMEVPNDK